MIAVRSARESDVARIAAIYAPYVTSTLISFEEEAPTEQEMRARMLRAGDRYPWLVASVDDDPLVAGYAYAAPHSDRAGYRWNVNVSVYLAPAYHGRGIGRRLYLSLFEILTRQNYVTAYAGITQPNPASVALHTSLGFTLCATHRKTGYKFGEWLDVLWYARPLTPHEVPPKDPITLTEALKEKPSPS